VPARLDGVEGRIDFFTLEWPAADGLALNDVAHLRLRLGGEIAADAYERCHATGAFILVDEATNDTVAAGMVRA
jgi:sulfate adenylyltransferase subunit 1 (EFTu-like GTPase family)